MDNLKAQTSQTSLNTSAPLKFSDSAANKAQQQQFMGLGEAIACMRRGGKVARMGWNGKGMWLRIRVTGIGFTDDNHYRGPYVEIKAADNSLMPWLCSAADLLANDWMEVQ